MARARAAKRLLTGTGRRAGGGPWRATRPASTASRAASSAAAEATGSLAARMVGSGGARTASAGLADRAHVEVRDAQGRHGRAVEPLAELAPQGADGGAHLGGPRQEVDGALVEAEVVGRPHDLAPFDHVDAIASEA